MIPWLVEHDFQFSYINLKLVFIAILHFKICLTFEFRHALMNFRECYKANVKSRPCVFLQHFQLQNFEKQRQKEKKKKQQSKSFSFTKMISLQLKRS